MILRRVQTLGIWWVLLLVALGLLDTLAICVAGSAWAAGVPGASSWAVGLLAFLALLLGLGMATFLGAVLVEVAAHWRKPKAEQGP